MFKRLQWTVCIQCNVYIIHLRTYNNNTSFSMHDQRCISQLMNNKGDCRTAPATPGLLTKNILHIFVHL